MPYQIKANPETAYKFYNKQTQKLFNKEYLVAYQPLQLLLQLFVPWDALRMNYLGSSSELRRNYFLGSSSDLRRDYLGSQEALFR